jgi:hypothetical protein
MNLFRSLIAVALVLPAASCSDKATAPAVSVNEEAQEPNTDPETGLPTNPSKARLPSSVEIVSDTQPNFGVDVSKLAPDQASILMSAWDTYKTILAGGEPECTAAFGASDGGTISYFCEGYDVTRAHTMASQGGVDGFEYGPMLDLLNGQRIERLRFYSQEDMAALERAAP